MASKTNETRRARKLINLLADQVIEGHIEAAALDRWPDQAKAEKVRTKVRKLRAQSDRAGRRLLGVLKRETEKAYLFSVRETGDGMEGMEIWFPKSQATVYERAVGPADIIHVTDWIYRQKLTAGA